MSIFNQKVGHSESTAANSAVTPPNFAVPAKLPEPGSNAVDNKRIQSRSISDGELALVHVSVDFVCACIALPLSLYLLSVISTASANSLHLLGNNTAIDCLFP